MNQLSPRQKKLIISPKERGRAKRDSSDNYSAIYENASSALLYLKSIIELLPYFEKYSDFKKAKSVCDLLSFELLELILNAVFPTGKEIGASLEDRIYFEPSKRNMNKVSSIAYLFKFSSDYLLQAFPENEYKHLQPRINELIKDLKSMMDTIVKNQELKEQLEEYRKHVAHFEPIEMGDLDRNFNIECLSCRMHGTDRTEIEAVSKIVHLPMCKADKNYDKTSKIWKKWYRIILPKKLVITWDDRKLLDELKIKTKKK